MRNTNFSRLGNSSFAQEVSNVIFSVGLKKSAERNLDKNIAKALQLILLKQQLPTDLIWALEAQMSNSSIPFSTSSDFEHYVGNLLEQNAHTQHFSHQKLQCALSCLNQLIFLLMYRDNQIEIRDCCPNVFLFSMVSKDYKRYECLFINQTSHLTSGVIEGVDYIFCQRDDFIYPIKDEYSTWDTSEVVAVLPVSFLEDQYVRLNIV